MKIELSPRSIVTTLFKILLIALGFYLIYAVRATLIYFGIAMVLSLMGSPLVKKLCQYKIKKVHIPKWAASIITMGIMLLAIIFISAMIIPALASELEILSTIDFKEVYSGLETTLDAFEETIIKYSFEVDFGHEHLKNHLGDFLNANTISSTFTNLLGSLGNLAIAVFSVIFMLFFFLKEEHLSRRLVMAILPKSAKKTVKVIVPKVKTSLGRYFIGLLIQQGIVFTFILIGLSIVGVDNAVTIALFASFLNLIPYIGPIIGMAFGIVLGLGEAYAIGLHINYMGLGSQIFLVFIVVQMIDNFVSQPLIFSNSINAHPLEIFIIISIAGTLAGIAGMVIAVPAYSVIRVTAFEFFPNHSFVKFLKREDISEFE